MRNQLEEVLERGQIARERMLAAARASIVGASKVEDQQQDNELEFESRAGDNE